MRYRHSPRSRAARWWMESAPLSSGMGGQRVTTTTMVEQLEPRALFSASALSDPGELIMLRPTLTLVEGVAPPPGSPMSIQQPGFQIQVVFPDDSLTASQKAIFADAAARWQSVILGDTPDLTFLYHGTTITVDDLRITATAPFIDGVGAVLGRAGPEFSRVGQGNPRYNYMPITGIMEFDSADVGALEAAGQLDDVILHEMGHVLGLGNTTWTKKGLISGSGTDDPRYTGALGNAQYQAIFGLPAGEKAPIENTGNPGTRDSHWREATFDTELMTGFLKSGTTLPMSLMTVAQYADLGYPGVDLMAADVFTKPGGGGNAYPTLGSLTDAVDPTPLNTPFLLTANGASDPDGAVASVRFYRETNNIPGLQVIAGAVSDIPGDLLLATDSDPTDGFSALVPTAPLPAGTYTYYALPTDNQNLIGIRGVVSTTNRISAAASPVLQQIRVNDGSAQRSIVKSVSLVFDQPVVLANGAMTMVRLNSGGSGSNYNTPPTNASSALSAPTTSDGGVTWTYKFVVGDPYMENFADSSGSLMDGIYTVSVDRTKVTAANGMPVALSGNLSLTFHRLFGDSDGNKSVNLADYAAFRLVFQPGGGETMAEGAAFDYNGNGQIQLLEYGNFRLRFMKAFVY